MQGYQKLDKIVVRYILLVAVLTLAIFNYKLIFAWVGKLWMVMTPIIAGFVIAYILNILMVQFERILWPHKKQGYWQKSRRPLAITLSLLTILLVMLFVIGLVVPQVYNVATEAIKAFPVFISHVEKWTHQLERLLPDNSNPVMSRFEIDWSTMLSNFKSWTNDFLSGFVNTTLSTVGSLASIIVNGVLALIFSLYLLMSKEKLIDQFLHVLTTYVSKKRSRKILYVLTTLDEAFTNFLTGEVIEATILGVMVTLGMWLFRFPYAGMIGVLTGVFALIPMLGAYISGILGMVLISVHSISQAFWFLLFIIILQQFEGNVVYPRIVGSSLGLPGMWVLFSITIGGGLLGIPGMLLGVPIASALYRIIKRDILERDGYSYSQRQAFLRHAPKDSFQQIAKDEAKSINP